MIDLENQDSPERWECLTDLVQLVSVSLTTKQHPTRTFGGKPVVVLDRAFLRRGSVIEESIPVEELPLFGVVGGKFSFAELALALRLPKLGYWRYSVADPFKPGGVCPVPCPLAPATGGRGPAQGVGSPSWTGLSPLKTKPCLPMAPWQTLGDRLRSRSLLVLWAEALYAVAAMTLGGLGRRFGSCRPDCLLRDLTASGRTSSLPAP